MLGQHRLVIKVTSPVVVTEKFRCVTWLGDPNGVTELCSVVSGAQPTLNDRAVNRQCPGSN